MANSEQILPLSACGTYFLARFRYGVKDSRQEEMLAHCGAKQLGTCTANALKGSVGSTTPPYLSGAEYISSRRESKLLFGRDISSHLLFVPIRDDPEMVVNLELWGAEAGLRRLGVAA